MKKIAVIGGYGFVGKAICASLSLEPDLVVKAASSRMGHAPIHCDLNQALTFENLIGYDCIINCSDTYQASPLELMAFCLKRGLKLIECTADPLTIQASLDRFRKDEPAHTGTVVLGAGLFPGISNILAKELIARTPLAQALQLTISVSPFSQAGRSTCELMARHFSYKTVVIEKGMWRSMPTLTEETRLLGNRGPFSALRLFFPEVVMLERSLKLSRIETFLVPMPRVLVPVISLLRHIFAIKALLPINTFALKLLRHSLLVDVSSEIHIHGATASEDGRQHEFLLKTQDGLKGIASGVQITLRSLLKHPHIQGMRCPDELDSWAEVEELYRRLSPLDSIQFFAEPSPSRLALPILG